MRTIISASRRTDIPAFYLQWFHQRLQDGFVDVVNPVVKSQTSRVNLHPEEVHTIVLWSKNYQPFLMSPLADNKNYNWFFHFSLVDCPEWEPRVPPFDLRIKQLRELVSRWSPQHINWRFDPVIFWNEGKSNNLSSFIKICDICFELGIKRCTFSFAHWYKKIIRRKQLPYTPYDPPSSQKHDIANWMYEIAKEREIVFQNCCNSEIQKIPGIQKGCCIDGKLLSQLAREPCTQAKDTSQRNACGCHKSKDIGSYDNGCMHGCLYCYANPILL